MKNPRFLLMLPLHASCYGMLDQHVLKAQTSVPLRIRGVSQLSPARYHQGLATTGDRSTSPGNVFRVSGRECLAAFDVCRCSQAVVH